MAAVCREEIALRVADVVVDVHRLELGTYDGFGQAIHEGKVGIFERWLKAVIKSIQ